LVSPVRVGKFTVGSGRCFVIAEAGVNHNGDLDLAHRLVDVAADAGADAVKFQAFTPEKLVSATAPKAQYQIATTGPAESQLEMLRQLVLPESAYVELAQHARDLDIEFLCTPFDAENADFLDSLNVPAFKIPSGEVTNHPLLAHVSAKGKPILLSTGMSTLSEVSEAVDAIRRAGPAPIALFHCVSEYPAAAGECNLRAMETMREALQVPVGWSDHTEGISISVAAVAAGAEMLEKHFTLDRNMAGPDHAASLEPAELAEMIRTLRIVESALGAGVKDPAPSETANRTLVRRSLHAARNLEKGTVLSPTDVIALRPGNGFPPSALSRILGRRLLVPLSAGEMLRPDHIATK
jgi:N,N'-diacetyllegionaminate synthase